jgi:hypothetical protein
MLADGGFTDAAFRGWTGYSTSSFTQGALVTARKPNAEHAASRGGLVGSSGLNPASIMSSTRSTT